MTTLHHGQRYLDQECEHCDEGELYSDDFESVCTDCHAVSGCQNVPSIPMRARWRQERVYDYTAASERLDEYPNGALRCYGGHEHAFFEEVNGPEYAIDTGDDLIAPHARDWNR